MSTHTTAPETAQSDHAPQTPPLRCAVVLFGCGRADGSEIQESVSILVHLSRLGARTQCYAPDRAQVDVVNHLTGAPSTEHRNGLVEAARIARGNIRPIAELFAHDYDALLFAGGFGAAKNLCDFALKGADCTAQPDVARVIREFHAAAKPIALCCIAPIIAARVLGTVAGGPGVSITLGQHGPAADAARAMGATHVLTGVRQAHTDHTARVVTTGAYMFDQASPAEIFEGIGAMVESTLKLATTSPTHAR